MHLASLESDGIGKNSCCSAQIVYMSGRRVTVGPCGLGDSLVKTGASLAAKQVSGLALTACANDFDGTIEAQIYSPS